jgi:Ca2+-binding RTX toxin-like protein
VTDTITDAGGAFDKVLFTGTAGQTFVLGGGVENLDLLGLAATRGTGNTLGNLLRGNSAANILNGLSGADTLSGGGGIDRLIGGAGNDTYIVDTLTDTLSEGVGLQGGTADTVRFTGTAGQTFTLGANLERLFLQGTSATNGTGNGLANQLTGNHLNNTLRGLGSNDTLFGGSGNDTLIGGAGRDQMSAGAGIDVFRFAAADSGVGGLADVITDFDDAGNDRIDLSTLFGPAMNFRGAQAFTGLGQVRINDIAGADVIVEVNRMGSLAADFAIRLTATTLASMTANDFVL